MKYTSILIHIVFSTKNRERTIALQQRPKIYAYIKGVCKKLNCFPLAVNGMGDHIHIFVDLSTIITVSDFVKTIKLSSSAFMKESHDFPDFQGWQEGYFAGSVSPDGKQRCINSINNQDTHHCGKSYEAELEWLNLKYEIEEKLKEGTTRV